MVSMGRASVNRRVPFEMVYVTAAGKRNRRPRRAADLMRMSVVERRFRNIIMNMLHAARRGFGYSRITMMMTGINRRHAGKRVHVHRSSVP